MAVETSNPSSSARSSRALQWGHGRMAVETSGPSKTSASDAQLQWGHGRMAVETWPFGPFRPVWGASMGPRPNGRGDSPTLGQTGQQILAASMGPRPNGRGDGTGRFLQQLLIDASMGPRPNGRGDPKV